MKKRNIVFLMTSALLAGPAVAQEDAELGEPLKLEQPVAKGIEVVKGVVVDDTTGKPIPGARLQVVGAPYSAMTRPLASTGTLRAKAPSSSVMAE